MFYTVNWSGKRNSLQRSYPLLKWKKGKDLFKTLFPHYYYKASLIRKVCGLLLFRAAEHLISFVLQAVCLLLCICSGRSRRLAAWQIGTISWWKEKKGSTSAINCKRNHKHTKFKQKTFYVQALCINLTVGAMRSKQPKVMSELLNIELLHTH